MHHVITLQKHQALKQAKIQTGESRERLVLTTSYIMSVVGYTISSIGNINRNVDLNNGSSAPGTKIQGYATDKKNLNQHVGVLLGLI